MVAWGRDGGRALSWRESTVSLTRSLSGALSGPYCQHVSALAKRTPPCTTSTNSRLHDMNKLKTQCVKSYSSLLHLLAKPLTLISYDVRPLFHRHPPFHRHLSALAYLAPPPLPHLAVSASPVTDFFPSVQRRTVFFMTSSWTISK